MKQEKSMKTKATIKTTPPEKSHNKISIGIGALALSCILLGFVIYCGAEYIISVKDNTNFSFLTTLIKGVSAIATNLIVITLVSLLIELTSIKNILKIW